MKSEKEIRAEIKRHEQLIGLMYSIQLADMFEQLKSKAMAESQKIIDTLKWVLENE